MTGSHFMNPSGLHNSLMHTTARDIARLGVAALGYPAMLDAWGKPNYLMNVAGPNARPFTIISSITMLTNGDYDVLGGKTGTLGGFGYNLLLYTSAPNGNRLVSVVIQAPTDAARYSDMRALLESIRIGHQWPLLFPMAMK
ncbi:hypothetical protein QMK50_23645 [Pseudomonas sp. P5_152]|nr:hypothetical protein [Pseudomonas sp. P5_152]MDX9667951.1 hypothetical protein [Pseudomonas sp. P5_152]